MTRERTTGPARGVRRGAALLAVWALAACGGDTRTRPAAAGAGRCPPAGDSALALAVTEFVRAAEPRPRRFLASFGSDSALPEAGLAALRQQGPTWMFPDDTAKQGPVRDKLRTGGSYPTLLLYYHGTRPAEGGRAEVRLSGRFVGGEHDGTVVPARAIALHCEGGRWVRPDTAAARVGRAA